MELQVEWLIYAFWSAFSIIACSIKMTSQVQFVRKFPQLHTAGLTIGYGSFAVISNNLYAYLSFLDSFKFDIQVRTLPYSKLSRNEYI